MNIKQTIMKRDGITAKEADEQIKEAREVLRQYIEDGDFDSAEDICLEYFGLEPDYVFELMEGLWA